MPHAMILALVAAVPIPWPCRLRMMIGSLFVVHGFVAVTVVVSVGSEIYSESSPEWHSLLFHWADSLLIRNLWISFVFPTLVWIGALLVMDRKGYLVAHQPGAP